MIIKHISQLDSLYDSPSFRAKNKLQSKLDKHSIHFIKSSPFIIISTASKDYKMDASPRGGKSGFVKIIDSETLVIPDAKGNNRIDSLKNILETNVIGTIFLIPGVDETLRINGEAQITTNSEYLNLFKEEQHIPKICIVIKVKEVFLHCAKALMRSKLWDEDSKIERTKFPTMGEMLKDQLGISEPAETHDAMVKRYEKDL
ncbi:pyridoxamine 5'-phosphate oxidase family protein [Flavobacteriaceae bacterium AU392]|nr:pyridoxamine 5'-phosphate oxidase family protein [Flavobacteriaceae bacterium]RKM85415.1 pyridoxamine 5'-phosphate oxidase family protein [Flavobacteriaceae bacterium AU392]